MNRRLKCAFTVRRAIWSCLAIASLSQPCSSNSAICCSRGPSRMESSFIPDFPLNYLDLCPWPGKNFTRRSTQVQDADRHSTHDYFNQLIYLPKIIAASLPSCSTISKKTSTGYPQRFRSSSQGLRRSSSSPERLAVSTRPVTYVADILWKLSLCRLSKTYVSMLR
jgi:hypothetical protein